LEWGNEIPPELLEQLTARAELNRTMAKRFKCSEEIYRDNSGIRIFDYLLHEPPKGRRAFANDVEPLRFKGDGTRKANYSESIPPAYAWSYLFSDTYQSSFTYRYLGESVGDYRLTHRIAFRGLRRFDRGTDIREWEGIAIVDAETHEIMRVEAAPRNFAPISQYQLRRYRMSFNLVGIRFRKKPRVHVLNVDFEETAIDDAVLKMPNRMVWQEYRMNASGDVFRKRTEERRYLHYRSFDVETREPRANSFAGD